MKTKSFIFCMLLLSSCLSVDELEFIDIEANFTIPAEIVRIEEEVFLVQQSSKVASSYFWDFGDGTVSSEAQPSHIYTNPGEYIITLISSKADGVTKDTTQQIITVLPKTQDALITKFFGDVAHDETGRFLTSLEDGYLLVGKKDINTLYVIKTDISINQDWTTEITTLTSGQVFANFAQQTSDGGYILAGFFQYSSVEERDAFVVKLDTDRNIEWQSSISPYRNDVYHSVLETSNGFITVGNVSSEEETAVIIYRYSNEGNLLENFSYSGLQSSSIELTTDGGYILACSNLDKEPMMLKLNNGFQTERLINLSSDLDISWSGQAHKAIQTQDGNYVFIGETSTENSEITHAYITKINNSGSKVLWNQNIVIFDESFLNIKEKPDGKLAVVGAHENPLTSQDIFVCLFSEDGIIEQQKLFGGNQNDWASSLEIAENGDVIVLGTSTSFSAGKRDLYVLRLNANLE